MKDISLEHLGPLAYGAYANLVIYPEKKAVSIIKEYTKELNGDIQTIRRSASTDIAPSELQSAISRYQQRYEFHLTDWLQSSAEQSSVFISPPSNISVSQIIQKKERVRDKYRYFREWRRRSLNVITKNIKQAQQQYNERKRNQRTVNLNGQNQRKKRT